MARYPNDQGNPNAAIPIYIVSAPTLSADGAPNDQGNPNAAIPAYEALPSTGAIPVYDAGGAPVGMPPPPSDGNTYGLQTVVAGGRALQTWDPVLTLSGHDHMTGPLFLSADPEGDVPLQATTKHYVDAVDNMKLNNFGDVMTGPLTLVGDPAESLEAATKAYVDQGDADLAEAIVAPRMGVTDGSEAKAGEIGEYLVVSNVDGVTLPSNIATQVCPLSLTPGDWEVWGAIDFRPAAGVSPNMVAASVSVHPDALPTDDDLMTGVGILNMITTSSLTTGQRQMLMTGQCRSNSAAPLDVYLVAQTTLGGSGLVTANGYICARRVR